MRPLLPTPVQPAEKQLPAVHNAEKGACKTEGRLTMELREWKLVKSEMTGHVHASGHVYGSRGHEDGDRILTSPVKSVVREGDVFVIQTENSVYHCQAGENRTQDRKIFRDFGIDPAN